MSDPRIARPTFVRAVFGGLERKLELRLGERSELERICGAGIGEIWLRHTTHRFYGADIREAIRLCFFDDTASTAIYTLSRYDALPVYFGYQFY